MSTKFTFAKAMLAAVAIVGTGCLNSAFAVTPYDLPYGLQWSFQSGGGGVTAQGMDVTADGNVHMLNRSDNFQTYGEGPTNQIASGVGSVNPQGQLRYGTTVTGMPGFMTPSQNYPAGVHAAGDKAYYSIYTNNTSHWNDFFSAQDPVEETGKMGNSPMVWSIDSSGIAETGQIDGNNSLQTAINDRNSLSIYSDNVGTLRIDAKKPVTTGLSVVGTQLRSTDSAMRTSTRDLIIVNDMVAGDFGTAADYEGYGLRSNGTGSAYLPGIARYNFDTLTLDGPAKQPILTYSGAEPTWSNMGVFLSAGVDQASGWYYGGGIAHSRVESKSDAWDPDGSGPAAPIAFSNLPAFADNWSVTPKAIGTAYDASNALQYSVTWNDVGYNGINSIVGVGDGTNRAIWAGEKGENAYFEMRDSAGAFVWGVDLALSLGTDPERITDVDVVDGEVYVQGYYTNSVGGTVGDGSGGRDSFLAKYDLSGNEVWTSLILGGATETAGDGRSGKLKSYIFSTSNGQWDNTTGYVHSTGSNVLLQKLIPGDFNGDGSVNSLDVSLATAAIGAGLPGDTTYDFDGDGNSTPADLTYWEMNIFDGLIPVGPALLGDTNNDGTVNTLDIDPFVLLLTDPAGYAAAFPGVDPLAVGDINLDTVVDTLDIDPFVALLTSGSLNGGAVPEPGSIVLLGLAGVAGFALVRRRK